MYTSFFCIYICKSLCVICLPPETCIQSPCHQGPWRQRVAGSEPWKADEVDPAGRRAQIFFGGEFVVALKKKICDKMGLQ